MTAAALATLEPDVTTLLMCLLLRPHFIRLKLRATCTQFSLAEPAVGLTLHCGAGFPGGMGRLQRPAPIPLGKPAQANVAWRTPSIPKLQHALRPD